MATDVFARPARLSRARYHGEIVMTEPADLTIQILREIRNEIVTSRHDVGERIDMLRTELGGRIDQTNARIDQTNVVVEKVEHALLDLAEQQRFMVRHLRALTSRDRTIEADVEQLHVRLDAVEKKLAST